MARGQTVITKMRSWTYSQQAHNVKTIGTQLSSRTTIFG